MALANISTICIVQDIADESISASLVISDIRLRTDHTRNCCYKQCVCTLVPVSSCQVGLNMNM